MKGPRQDETEFVSLDFTKSEIYVLYMALLEIGEPPSSGDLPCYKSLLEHLRTAYTLKI